MRVPRVQTFPLPGPERWDRGTRDKTPRPKPRAALSVMLGWVLTVARFPRHPQAEGPGSPEPHGPRTATETEWPVPAELLQPGSPRREWQSRGIARREMRMG